MAQPALVLGLTGGIATGKSTFSAALRRRGVAVVDADQLARAAVAPGTPGIARVVEAFGPEVLGPDGGLDRAAMARRVFGDPAARTRLEHIVHPAVRALFAAERERQGREGCPLLVYDVPLLYEVGLEGEVDRVAVVWAPRELQLSRLASRDGLDREAAQARLAAQWPVDVKAARADAVIVNDGEPGALEAKAERLLADLRGGLPRRVPNGQPARY